MTIDELAVYLRLPKSSLYKLVQNGQIPGKKIGKNWRFHRLAVDRWLDPFTEQHDGSVPTENTDAFFGSGESHDIAEHAALVGEFDVRLNQLASGKFHGKVSLIKTPGMMIFEERYRRKTEIQGAAPEDYVILGTNVASHRSEIQWCGTTINHQRFACSGPGAPIDFVMPNQAHDVCVMVKPEVLAGAISQQAYDALIRSKTIDFTAAAGRRLIAMLTGSIREYAKSPELLDEPYIVRSLESQFLEILSACIGDSVLSDRMLPVSKHKTHVRQAIEFAERSIGPVTVAELATAVGISLRSLEYAFRDVLDVSPESYLRFHRLNAAHRELLTTNPQMSSVTNIALKWGFGHAGRFSVMYRKFFNEKPSESLRRV